MRPAVSLSSDSLALLAEQATLQTLATESTVTLTPEQWTALAEITLEVQEIRHGFEASIAQPTQMAQGTYRLEIPAYAGAGDALRERFYAALADKLGTPTAEEIRRTLGSALEGHFAGFGVGVQTLDFKADADGVDTDYQVTRTAQFWNSVDAKDRLTTRRETYFPAREDPSGQLWGPFLSVLAARIAQKS